MKRSDTLATKKEVVETPKHKKEVLLSAKVFANRRDILNALINENEELSIEEAQIRINNYMKGKVK